jgi:antitoxin VapB
MTATAKLFTHGRSQAVRLPKEFRLPGTEVRVSKVGDLVILQPIDANPGVLWDLIDALAGDEFMPNGREQPPMPRDPDVFEP